MYSAEEFKQDLLLNLDNTLLKQAIEKSLLEFVDTTNFTRVQWDTYCRKLTIYCEEDSYKIIEENQAELLMISKSVHGVKDSYIIMNLLIIKKNLNGVFQTNNLEVIIDNKIKFNKENDCKGEGGFSRVYKYRCDILNTDFAYKVLDPSSFNNSPYEIDVARFINEAKILLKFTHNNIVKVYDIGKVIPNSYYIKMEWIDGLKLKDYINENGPIDVEKFLNISKQIVSAIEYSHSMNILHRDLVERNIMINNEGIIKVLDFGLSKNYKDGIDLTTISTAINTDNMAPELKDSINDYSVQSDIYSIGCIMYRILTNKSLNMNYLTELNNLGIQNDIIEIIKKSVAVSLSERYEDCSTLYDSLENINKSQDLEIENEQVSSENFSLDEFKALIDSSITEISVWEDFNHDSLSYKKFIEENLEKVIKYNKFVTHVNVVDLFKYWEKQNISYYSKYKFYIEDLKNMKKFYDTLSKDDKDNFIHNIENIINKKVKYYNEDDPFKDF